MTLQESAVFEPLPMRREELIPVSSNQYRVTEPSGAILEVEADTAYEAFQRSGLHGATKIERLVDIKHIIVTKEVFVHNKIPQKEAVESPDLRQETLLNLKRRRTPVISAGELWRLMEILRGNNSLLSASVSAASTTGILKKEEGEGFDEIIPDTMPVNATLSAGPQADETSATEKSPEHDIPPAQELSQAEIDKLLKN